MESDETAILRGSALGACSYGRGYHGSAPHRLSMAVLPTDVLFALPEKLNSLQIDGDGGHGLEDGIVTTSVATAFDLRSDLWALRLSHIQSSQMDFDAILTGREVWLVESWEFVLNGGEHFIPSGGDNTTFHTKTNPCIPDLDHY